MTAIVNRLISKGLVIECGKNSGNLGRRPISLSVGNDLGYIVGADIGSFLLRVVIADVTGSVCHKVETQTGMADGRDAVLARTFDAIHKAIEQSRVPKHAVRGIGMAHSGVIDCDKGVVLSFPRPGQTTQWKNVPLRDMLEAEFGVAGWTTAPE